MKRLIYISTMLLALLAINPLSYAQTTQQIFNSKKAEYEVGVKRNIPNLAQTSFNAAMAMITDEINSLNQQIQNTTNQTTITALTNKRNAAQQIFNDLQALQSNLSANFNQIMTKMNDFAASL